MAKRNGGESTMMDSFQEMKVSAGYDAVKPSKHRRRKTGLGGTADAHLGYSGYEYWQLCEFGNEFLRNNPYVAQGIERCAQNVMRGGMTLEMQTGDTGLDAEIKSDWYDWSSDGRHCDAQKLQTFDAMAETALKTMWGAGDCLFNPLTSGSLQAVEGYRIVSPTGKDSKTFTHGVQLDAETAAPVAYSIAKPEIGSDRLLNGPPRNVNCMPPIAAFDADGEWNAYHIYKQNRFSQSRGVPIFVACMDQLGMLDDLGFAKLVQAQVAACIAAFIKSEKKVPFGGGMPDDNSSADDDYVRTNQSIKPGTILRIRPNEDVVPFVGSVQSGDYIAQARFLLRIVFANLGMPLSIALLDSSDSNFSGSRFEFEQARRGFEAWQKFIIEKLYVRSLRWRIRRMLDAKTLRGNSVQKLLKTNKLFNHKWQTEGWPYIEPLKDATADRVILDKNLDSPRGVQSRKGRDFPDIVTETCEDNGMLIEKALEKAAYLNGEYPDADVTWRDVLNPQNAAPVAIMVDAGGEPQVDDPKKKKGASK